MSETTRNYIDRAPRIFEETHGFTASLIARHYDNEPEARCIIQTFIESIEERISLLNFSEEPSNCIYKVRMLLRKHGLNTFELDQLFTTPAICECEEDVAIALLQTQKRLFNIVRKLFLAMLSPKSDERKTMNDLMDTMDEVDDIFFDNEGEEQKIINEIRRIDVATRTRNILKARDFFYQRQREQFEGIH